MLMAPIIGALLTSSLISLGVLSALLMAVSRSVSSETQVPYILLSHRTSQQSVPMMDLSISPLWYIREMFREVDLHGLG